MHVGPEARLGWVLACHARTCQKRTIPDMMHVEIQWANALARKENVTGKNKIAPGKICTSGPGAGPKIFHVYSDRPSGKSRKNSNGAKDSPHPARGENVPAGPGPEKNGKKTPRAGRKWSPGFCAGQAPPKTAPQPTCKYPKQRGRRENVFHTQRPPATRVRQGSGHPATCFPIPYYLTGPGTFPGGLGIEHFAKTYDFSKMCF